MFAFIAWVWISENPVHAQSDDIRYGRVDDALVHMEKYEADTSAKAVILGKKGQMEITHTEAEGFHMRYTVLMRIKIFESEAFDLANFRIPLRGAGSNQERLTNIKGVTFTPENGRVNRSRMRNRDVFEEEVSSGLTTMNFTLPNVQEGTVFDLEYTITSPHLHNLPIWYFQSAYPTVYSELTTYIPEYFRYSPLMQGFLTLDHREQTTRNRTIRGSSRSISVSEQIQASSQRSPDITFTEHITEMRMENIPAFKDEPYMNAAVNYISKIEHELTSFRAPDGTIQEFNLTWDQLSRQMMVAEFFGMQLNRSGFLSDAVQKIKSDYNSDAERMAAAHRLIRDEMRWNRESRVFANQNLRASWRDKQGNSADINLLLVLLLQELGLDAHPVLASTRSHGMVNVTQPMLNSFNYVIAHVNLGEIEFVLDATEKNLPFHLLPLRALNERGKLMSVEDTRWVELKPYGENSTLSTAKVKVEPCGSIHATLNREKSNYHRLAMYNTLSNFESEEKYMDEFESVYPDIDLLDFQVEKESPWGETLLVVYEFKMPEFDSSPKDVLYLNPLLIDQLESNPFRLEDRKFPVDFIYPHKKTYRISINIPEGYEIEDLPNSTQFAVPDEMAVFTSHYELTENQTIEIEIGFEIKKELFVSDEYPALKDFYARMVEEQARNIVLRKI